MLQLRRFTIYLERTNKTAMEVGLTLVNGKVRTKQIATRLEWKRGELFLIYLCEQGNHECVRNMSRHPAGSTPEEALSVAEYHLTLHSAENGGRVTDCPRCTRLYKEATGYYDRYPHKRPHPRKSS